MNARRMKRPVGWLLTICLILTMMLTVAGPARAASTVILNLKEGTLLQAILDANTAPGEDTITFNVSGTILLTKPLPAITDPAGLTIDGAGQSITISGNNAVSVMLVNGGAALTLRNLTIADGNAQYGGGGIYNIGTLTVNNSTFSGNQAGTGALGGGISNWGTLAVTDSTFLENDAYFGGGISNSSGTLSVTNSTFSGNDAVFGGGIFTQGMLDVTNSTFSSNTVSGGGGGIAIEYGLVTVANSAFSANSANLGGGISISHGQGTVTVTGSTFSGNSGFSAGGGIANYDTLNQNGGTLDVTDSTFSDNSAPNGGGIFSYGTVTVTNATFSGNSGGGSGIFNGGTLTLKNAIVANSTAVNCLNNGSLIDDGGNLSWPDSSCPGLNADPVLGPLQDNGGPTQTHALLAGSPAIDVALLANCPAADQRGVSRPQGLGCDIGAFELGTESVAPTITINTPTDGAIYVLGQVVMADYACQDEAGGSGIASCVGTVPNGGPIDTGSVGAKTFTVNAADNAGNLAPLTHHYSVVYAFSGFFQPVDDLPTLNLVQAGVGIPVRFSLSGDHGLDIFAAGYPASPKIPCSGGAPEDVIEETVKAGSSSLSYDAASDTYTYVWVTSRAWAGTCRQLIVRLNDGTEHMANFKFVR